MADVTINNLPAITSVVGTNIVPITDGLATYRATITQLKSGLSLSWGDISGKPTIPTNTSQLTNDSGFLVPTSTPVVKAWVCFNGQGANGTNQPIKSSYNVTSVYKNGTGNYNVNFSPGVFTDGNIAVIGSWAHVNNVSWGSGVSPAANPTSSYATIFTADVGKGLINSYHVSVLFLR